MAFSLCFLDIMLCLQFFTQNVPSTVRSSALRWLRGGSPNSCYRQLPSTQWESLRRISRWVNDQRMASNPPVGNPNPHVIGPKKPSPTLASPLPQLVSAAYGILWWNKSISQWQMVVSLCCNFLLARSCLCF